jgi:hypothetical protein
VGILFKIQWEEKMREVRMLLVSAARGFSYLKWRQNLGLWRPIDEI